MFFKLVRSAIATLKAVVKGEKATVLKANAATMSGVTANMEDCNVVYIVHSLHS